jgi:hypothetical protein
MAEHSIDGPKTIHLALPCRMMEKVRGERAVLTEVRSATPD